MQSAAAAAAAAAPCIDTTAVVAAAGAAVVTAAAVLLLHPAVPHRVPDGNICCWHIESDPSVFFSSKRDFLLVYPLAVLCCIYGLDLPTSPAITGMRGAKAGCSASRQIPSCIIGTKFFFVCFVVEVWEAFSTGDIKIAGNGFYATGWLFHVPINSN